MTVWIDLGTPIVIRLDDEGVAAMQRMLAEVEVGHVGRIHNDGRHIVALAPLAFDVDDVRLAISASEEQA